MDKNTQEACNAYEKSKTLLDKDWNFVIVSNKFIEIINKVDEKV